MNNKYLEAYSKRVNHMSLCIFLCAFIILCCFFNLQILPHPDLKKVVMDHGYTYKKIVGSRGKIFDTNDKNLAASISRYTFWVNTNKNYNKNLISKTFSLGSFTKKVSCSYLVPLNLR